MKNRILPTAILLFTIFFVQNAFAQISLKLQYLEDKDAWGVFAKPDEGLEPSNMLIPGSGQVTIVLPTNYPIGSVVNYAGSWTYNVEIKSPIENPERDYGSFGWHANVPRLFLEKDQETLLFTFDKVASCPDTLYLIDNENDPFCDLPNSAGTNPVNEHSIYDPSNGEIYSVSGIYGPDMWNCDPEPQISNNHELFKKEDFKVHPNPAKGFTLVEMPFAEGDLNIINQWGQIVSAFKGYKSGQIIETGQLSAGLYSIVIQNSWSRYCIKLIVIK